MNRKRISEALSGIQPEYLAECETYAPKLRKLPTDKEHTMGRYENTTKHSSRKILALVLAACLIMGLGITAYATGLLPSFLSKWVHSFYYEPVTDELRESRPDYAEWLEQQWETQAILEEMAENAQTVNEEKKPEGLPDASITLLESYYDGEKFTMSCRYEAPQWPVAFDFDENHPLFSELVEPEEDYWMTKEDWKSFVPLVKDQERIANTLNEKGHVGFSTYDFFISDHVLVNDEDPGFFHTDPDDNEGIFYVDPFYSSVFGTGLPESCMNLPELKITFTVRCTVTHYWLEGDTVRWVTGDILDYPVSFSIQNIHQ